MRLFIGLLLGGSLVAGLACDGKPKPKGKGTGSDNGAGSPAVVAEKPGRPAADAFLASLRDGKATPDHLTAAFKAELGKTSPGELQDWLAQFQGTNFVVGDEAKFGGAVVLRGRAESPQAKNAFALRMVKEGDAFKADWLHRSDRMGSGSMPAIDPDLAAATDTLRNFLDTMLGGDPLQCQSLMTVKWKKEESPPPPGSPAKGGAEYDVGFLTQRMRSWKMGFIGYAVTKADLGPNKDTATFAVDMDAGSAKTPHAVTARKVDGRWRIESFAK